MTPKCFFRFFLLFTLDELVTAVAKPWTYPTLNPTTEVSCSGFGKASIQLLFKYFFNLS